LNARKLHIKYGIGYKNGDKYNSRVKSNGKEFIKFTNGNSHQEKKKSINNTNHVSYASKANVSYVSHMSYHDFDASYVLIKKIWKSCSFICWASPQEVKDLCVDAKMSCY
jgi:hypothetical protein